MKIGYDNVESLRDPDRGQPSPVSDGLPATACDCCTTKIGRKGCVLLLHYQDWKKLMRVVHSVVLTTVLDPHGCDV